MKGHGKHRKVQRRKKKEKEGMSEVVVSCLTFICLLIQAIVICILFGGSNTTVEDVTKANWIVILIPVWLWIFFLGLYLIIVFVNLVRTHRKRHYGRIIFLIVVVIFLVGLGTALGLLVRALSGDEMLQEDDPSISLLPSGIVLIVTLVIDLILLASYKIYYGSSARDCSSLPLFCAFWGSMCCRGKTTYHSVPVDEENSVDFVKTMDEHRKNENSRLVVEVMNNYLS